MDRLHAMEVFVRVVESGSFSAAARDLRIGQPAVSKIIAALEYRLDVRLLMRSSRQMLPTEAGQAYYDHAKRALAEADEADGAAQAVGGSLAGRLRVCAPVTFGRLQIVPRLGALLEEHPRLRIECVMDDRPVDLLAENIDLALRLGTQADSALTARRLGSARRLLVAAPSYLERAGRPRTPGELIDHQAIIYAQGAGGEAWTLRQHTREVSVNVPGRMTCTAAEGVREAVLAGLGVALVSEWMMPEAASGVVEVVLEDWTLAPLDLWAVFPSGRLPTAKARMFADWVEQLIKG